MVVQLRRDSAQCVERQVQLQHVDAWLAQKAQLTTFGVLLEQGLDTVSRDPARAGNSLHLPCRVLGRDVRVQSGPGCRDRVGGYGLGPRSGNTLAHGVNHGHWRGTPFSADEWVTEMFVRRDDRWRCAFSALTPNYAAGSP